MFSYASRILKLAKEAGATSHLMFVLLHLWKNKPIPLSGKINISFNFVCFPLFSDYEKRVLINKTNKNILSTLWN